MAPAFSTAPAQQLVPLRDTWRYIDDGANRYGGTLPFSEPAYNDSAWKSGQARLGYGGDGEATVILFGPSSGSKYITAYLRKEFTWDGVTPPGADVLLMEFTRDDGAMVYLNGELVDNSNMTGGTVNSSTRALTAVSGADEWRLYQREVRLPLLQPGRNVIAVGLHQNAPDSSDLGFDLRLELGRRHLFFSQSTLLAPPHGISSLLGFLDITGDGAPEMFSHVDSVNADRLEMRVNDGAGGFGPAVTVDGDFYLPVEMMPLQALAGDPEEVLVRSESDYRLYRRTAAGGLEAAGAVATGGFLGSVAVADFNADGLDDLVEYSIIGAAQGIRWRRNAGGGSFDAPVTLVTLTASSDPPTVKAGDFTGDGRPDILFSVAPASAVRLLVNQGGASPSFVGRDSATGLSFVRGLGAGDFDGDGDLDFAAVNRSASSVSSSAGLTTFLNSGTGTFIRQPGPLEWDHGSIQPRLGDLDADGDPDLVETTETGHMVSYEADGRGNWVRRRSHDPVVQFANWPELFLADIDHDGQTDVANYANNTARAITWYRNQRTALPRINAFTIAPGTLTAPGSATLTWDVENAEQIYISPGPAGPVTAALPVFIDRDTAYTLRAVNRFGEVTATRTAFYASQQWSPKVTGPAVASRYYSGALLDVNQDGLLDVAHLSGQNVEGQGVRRGTLWAPMTAGRTFGPPQLVAADEQNIPPQSADVNGDGRLDLLTGASDISVVWHPVLAGGGFGPAVTVMTTPASNRVRDFVAADFDDDGDVDVAVRFQDYNAQLFLNDGAGAFTPGAAVPMPPNFRTVRMETADADADGLPDIIFTEEVGGIYIAWNNDDGTFALSATSVPGSGDVEFARFADLNGDTFPDLVTQRTGESASENATTVMEVEWGRGDRLPGTRGAVVLFRVPAVDPFTGLALEDLDNDGDHDLVVAREGLTPLQWAASDGRGTFSELLTITPGIQFDDGAYHVLPGDIDGDGDADLVTFFDYYAAAVFNNGPIAPELTVISPASLTEAGAAGEVILTPSNLRKPLPMIVTLDESSTANPADFALGPPDIILPVPGNPRQWSVSVQPGKPLRFTVSAADDVHAEAAENVVLAFSSPDPVTLVSRTPLNWRFPARVPIDANDYVVIATGASGEGTLRQALANVNDRTLAQARNGVPAEISFSDAGGVLFSSVPRDVSLSGPEIQMDDGFIVRGPAMPGRVRVIMQDEAIFLKLSAGDGFAGREMLFEDLDFAPGTAGMGNAVVKLGRMPLILRRCGFAGFRSAISNERGLCRLEGCSVTGSTHRAMTVHGGTAELVNCTVSGGHGIPGVGVPGIVATGLYDGSLDLVNTTIADNTGGTLPHPTGEASGLTVWVASMPVRLSNCLIAGNRQADGTPADVSGPVVSLGGNVIGVLDGATGMVAGLNDDTGGTAAAPLDVMLGPLTLQPNGLPVHPLLSFTRERRSPAINAGRNAALTAAWFGAEPWLDQRGAPRAFPPPSGRVDAGAYEMQNTAPYLTEAAAAGAVKADVYEDAAALPVAASALFDDAEDGASGLTLTVLANSRPDLVSAAITADGLLLAFARDQTGSAVLEVQAADRFGARVTAQLPVTVTPAVNPVLAARVLTNPLIAGGGAQAAFEFTLQNQGPSDAVRLVLLLDAVLPPGVSIAEVSVTRGTFDAARREWTLDLPEDGIALLSVNALAGTRARGGTDVLRNTLTVGSSDPLRLEPLADDTAAAALSIISPADIRVQPAAGAAVSRQSGLFTQRIRFTNDNPLPLPGLRLLAAGALDEWMLWNATGATFQGSFLEVPGPIAPGQAVEVVFEFYSLTRSGAPAPEWLVEILPLSPVRPDGQSAGAFAIERIVPLAGGDKLLEWPAVAGRRYEVQYSADLMRWTPALPAITAGANRVQWIDAGLPKTLTHPSTEPVRYYRVRELGSAAD